MLSELDLLHVDGDDSRVRFIVQYCAYVLSIREMRFGRVILFVSGCNGFDCGNMVTFPESLKSLEDDRMFSEYPNSKDGIMLLLWFMVWSSNVSLCENLQTIVF